MSVWMSMCRQTYFTLLLLQFFSDSHKIWHTCSVCQYAQTVEQIFKILIVKFLANFLNLVFRLLLPLQFSGERYYVMFAL